MVKSIDANVEYTYLELREKPDLKDMAADWFNKKWGVPKEAYLECMTAYLNKETENGWYLCMLEDQIVGGLGVIDNDFHEQSFFILTPVRRANLRRRNIPTGNR